MKKAANKTLAAYIKKAKESSKNNKVIQQDGE
jgi:hypothetical protein